MNKDIVYNIYKEDFDRFGYTIEGNMLPNAYK